MQKLVFIFSEFRHNRKFVLKDGQWTPISKQAQVYSTSQKDFTTKNIVPGKSMVVPMSSSRTGVGAKEYET